MYDINVKAKELADKIIEMMSNLEVERDIGVRNTLSATIKDDMQELERMMMLREASKISLKVTKVVVNKDATVD